MFFLRNHYTHPEFKVGLRDFLRPAPGIAAWGLMTGVAMVKSGIGLVESLLMAEAAWPGRASGACSRPGDQ